MAKKKKTRANLYSDALAKDGIQMEECKVLAFSFPREAVPQYFHYEAMKRHLPYLLFDCFDHYAYVVIRKGDEETERGLVEALGDLGTPIAPDLR